MGLFTNTEKKEMDEAQNEYVNSVQDIANTEQQMSEDIDYLKTNQEAFDNANEVAKQQAEINAAKQQELNTLNNSASKMSSAINNTEAADRTRTMSAEVQKEQQRIQQQRDERNKQIIAAKQLASEEAKMKYELATQKYNQAKANWTNAFKVLQTLGCAVSAIPGLQWVGIATTGVATLGTAIA